MTSSLSTSTSVLNTMSAINSWLPVPRLTGWMLGRKSEMRAKRRTVGASAVGAGVSGAPVAGAAVSVAAGVLLDGVAA